jgi:hypothetical protein
LKMQEERTSTGSTPTDHSLPAPKPQRPDRILKQRRRRAPQPKHSVTVMENHENHSETLF